jgi:hypothetical protein
MCYIKITNLRSNIQLWELLIICFYVNLLQWSSEEYPRFVLSLTSWKFNDLSSFYSKIIFPDTLKYIGSCKFATFSAFGVGKNHDGRFRKILSWQFISSWLHLRNVARFPQLKKKMNLDTFLSFNEDIFKKG